MKYFFSFVVIFFSLVATAQNVGVGTTTPVERLDVNGNINVTGTIKANGVDGQANQVLMKNNSGVLAWGDPCDYKNLTTFDVGSGNWTVPAGITKVLVEVWGGGGGGSNGSGGGGGGYVRAVFNVTPGSNISYSVGFGGSGVNADPAGATGESSTVTINAPNIYVVTATGGFGGGGTQTGMSVAHGGNGSIIGPPGHTNFIILAGGTGKFSVNNFFNNGATYYEHAHGADGGDGANSPGSAGMGRMRLHTTNPTSIIKSTSSSPGKQPGGGGGGAFVVISNGSTGVGGSGGAGLVMIRY
jgi:hypothetical protein